MAANFIIVATTDRGGAFWVSSAALLSPEDRQAVFDVIKRSLGDNYAMLAFDGEIIDASQAKNEDFVPLSELFANAPGYSLSVTPDKKPLDQKDNVSTLTRGEMARAQGYTGDCCDMCGLFTMKRNGTCLTCDSCGSTTGCG